MLNVILLVAVIAVLILLVVGALAAGYFLRDLRQSMSAIRSRLANLEESDFPEPAVFDARTPQELKEHKFDDDGDSAVIQAKTPKMLAKEKDTKLNEELDRLSGRRP